ncbi:MAG: Unspecified monosaccharide ABC transport system, permease component Ia (FIG025991) / Unspecified monosaccharide ABC transport system, permease component Ib (FIG143636), partial [uncultured Thermomicrobiales bacterium]
ARATRRGAGQRGGIGARRPGRAGGRCDRHRDRRAQPVGSVPRPCRGGARLPPGASGDAGLRRPADPWGARLRYRRQSRAVQHRHRGAARDGRLCGRPDRVARHGSPPGPASAAGCPRRGARGWHLGPYPGGAEGHHRRPRSHHDDHAELSRLPAHHLLDPEAIGLVARRSTGPGDEPRARRSPAPDPPRADPPARRGGARAGGGARAVVRAVQDNLRLPAPDRRPLARRGVVRRHSLGSHDRDRDGARRSARGFGWSWRNAGASRAAQWHAARAWLHGDRRGARRAEPSDRDHLLRAPLWSPQRWRTRDAEPIGREPGDRTGAPGTGNLRRRRFRGSQPVTLLPTADRSGGTIRARSIPFGSDRVWNRSRAGHVDPL